MSEHRWDHLVLDRSEGRERLDRLGADGWELIAADGSSIYLRRPRLSFRDRVTLEQKRAVYSAHGVAFTDGEVRR